MKEMEKEDFRKAFWFGIHKPNTSPPQLGIRPSDESRLNYVLHTFEIWTKILQLPQEEYSSYDKNLFSNEVRKFIFKNDEKEIIELFKFILKGKIEFENHLLTFLQKAIKNSDSFLEFIKYIEETESKLI